MADRSLKYLVRILQLIDKCTAEELDEAASYLGRSRIGTILRVAADMKYEQDGDPYPTKKGSYHSGSEKKQLRGLNGLAVRLEKMVYDKKLFRQNKDLTEYLQDSGVAINLDPRDSRGRTFSKLLNWLDSLPSKEQGSMYRRLFRILPKTETSGWFEAMRN